MGAVPLKASDVDRRLTGIWRFGLPPALQDPSSLPYATFLSMPDTWIKDRQEGRTTLPQQQPNGDKSCA